MGEVVGGMYGGNMEKFSLNAKKIKINCNKLFIYDKPSLIMSVL